MERLLRLISILLITFLMAACAHETKDTGEPKQKQERTTRSTPPQCAECKSTGLRMGDCDEPYARCTARCPKIPSGMPGGNNVCQMNCTREHSRCISQASIPNCPASCR